MTSLGPQPENHTELQHFERNQPVSLGRHGDAWIINLPNLPSCLAVRNVKGFGDGKVVAEVALFGTNAVHTGYYLPEDYAQLKNAQEVAEAKNI